MKRIIQVSVLLSLILSVLLSLSKVYIEIPELKYRISHLDVDSERNIYLSLSTGSKEHVLKLNRQLDTVYIYSRNKLSKNKIFVIEDMAQSQGNIYLLTTLIDTHTNQKEQQVLYLNTDKITGKAKNIMTVSEDRAITYTALSVNDTQKEVIIKTLGTDKNESTIEEATYLYLDHQKENSKLVKKNIYAFQSKEGIYSLFSTNNQVGCLSKLGRLYLNNGSHMEKQEIKDLNDIESPLLMAKTDIKKNLYVMEQRNGNIRKIDLTQHTSSLINWGDTYILDNIAIPYQNSYKLAFVDENTIAAAVQMDSEAPSKIILTNNGTVNKDNIEHFGLTLEDTIRLALRYFLIYYFSILGGILTVAFVIKFVKNSRTVLLKTSICITPIIIGGFVGVAVVVNLWYLNLIKIDTQQQLQDSASLIESRLSPKEITNLQQGGSYDSQSYSFLKEALNNTSTLNRLIWVKENELFTGIDHDYPPFYKLSHFKKPDELELYKTVVEQNKIVQGEIIYSQGQYMVCIVPIRDTNKKVVALVETSKNKLDNRELEQTFMKWVSLTVILALSFMLLFIILVIRRLIRPIHEFEVNLQEFEATGKSQKLQYSSNDEFYRMSKILNNLLEDTQIQLYNLSRISSMYSRFIPERYLALLNKKSIADVKLGDSVSFHAPIAVISFETGGIEESNRHFEAVNKIIDTYGAVLTINNRALSDLTAIYKEDAEKALEAQLLIANALGNEGFKEKMSFVTILDKSLVQFEIGGEKERLAAMILSKRLDCIYKHMNLFQKCGCSFIVTEEVLNEIHHKEEYNFRYIGYILDEDEANIQLYDFFEVDNSALRQAKKETQMIFDKALRCFYQGDLYGAKNLFSVVLRENKEDEIARWYVFRCDILNNEDINDEALSLGSAEVSCKF